jgi:hypothetical protein
MSDLFPLGRRTPEGALIRTELAQAIEDFRDAFVGWAVAAYAEAIEPSQQDNDRLTRITSRKTAMRRDRDDKAMGMVAALFTWGGDPDSPAYDAIDPLAERGETPA